MSIVVDQLPLTDTVAPTDAAEVAELVQTAYQASQAVYPLGGCTAQDYGHTPTRPGIGLDLTGIAKIVDYTPRDMTILVEAGVRMVDLSAALAGEGQHLPIDVPRSHEATIGGVVATNWSGPRRYGHGTIRDYVIGIHAVDGRGVAFKGGGRVVKNVAGYDFCKLLTGSLGTLGIITELALKVKPLPEQSATIVAACPDLDAADQALSRLVQLPAPPVSIDLLAGAAWDFEPANQQTSPLIAVRAEGTAAEVAWLADQAQYELWSAGGMGVRRLDAIETEVLWTRQIEFADRGCGEAADDAALVVKIAVPPSSVTTIVRQLLAIDAGCTIQAHAGNGIFLARFALFHHGDITKVLVGKLRPAAVQLGGSLVVVSGTLQGLTPSIIWGGRTEATVLMERIKQQFDPRKILNPGRYMF